MPSTLGKYTLLQTLGKGAHSKVKLAVNKSTREYFAVKILKKQNKNIDQKFLDLVMTEVEALTHLHHPNIVNMIEFSNDGVVQKADKSTYSVIYIVLELATGGEFFDYIATGGQFPERIARFYFRQLIEALDYVHTRGAAHRDLKPENLLFDANYNLKVADFGFAAPVDGRDGSGFLKTKLGTESYMAPEINLKRAYSGASVDLFASGIILFIMITQHPPFTKAIPDDPYYKLVCINKLDIFWKAHSRNKPGGEGFFSAEFIDLISSMIQYDPEKRLSMEQVKAHPWYTDANCASLEEIQEEFLKRKVAIDAENENKRKEKEQEKLLKKQELAKQGVKKKAYPQVHRGGEEEEKGPILEEYVGVLQKQTELFSTFEPDTIYEALVTLANNKALTHEEQRNKFKIKMNFLVGEGKKAQSVELAVKLFIVPKETEDGEDKICIDVQRLQGDVFVFFEEFQYIKEYLGELIDTTHELTPIQATN